MADKNLSKFEQQRQKDKAKFEKERNQWKKKESRSRQKKSRKVDLAPIVVKVVAIALAAALVLGAGAIYAMSYGFPGRFMPTLTVAGKTIFQPEFTYFYYHEYQRHYDNAARYAQLAEMGLNLSYFGLSTTVSPFGLPMTGREEDEPDITWDEFLREQTIERLQSMYSLLAEARKAGIALSAEDTAAIEEEINEIKFFANNQHAMSLNAYLRMTNNPPGINQRFLRNLSENQRLLELFTESKLAEFREGYDLADLRAEYEEDTTEFDLVDLRVLPFAKLSMIEPESGDETEEAYSARLDAANAEIKAEAEAFLAALSDEDSFIKTAEALHDGDEDFDAFNTLNLLRRKSELDNRFRFEEELLSDWAFDSARRASDTILFEDNNNYFAVMLTRPAYAVNLVDFYSQVVHVQDLQFLFDEDLISAAVNDAFAEARDIIEAWETTAPAGQLAERYTPSAARSATLSPMDEWLFEAGRSEGDSGIVSIYNDEGVLTALRVVWIDQIHEGEYNWTGELSAQRQEADFEEYLEGLVAQNPATERRIGMWFSLRAARPLIEAFIMMQMFGGF